jgi:predicted MFS family arabinose efflux permease
MVLGLAIWGFASWGINPPLQSLIVIHGGPRVSLLVAVNASAIYLGMGLGNSLGAAAVNLAGLTGLPWATLAVMALSVATALAARATGKRRTPQTS